MTQQSKRQCEWNQQKEKEERTNFENHEHNSFSNAVFADAVLANPIVILFDSQYMVLLSCPTAVIVYEQI
jgi:hypothetical protein